MRGLIAIALGWLAGCGDAPRDNLDLGPCGGNAQHCCHGDTCDTDYQCVTGFCQATPCGDEGDRCCLGNCAPNLLCAGDVCTSYCGHLAQPCCVGGGCSDPGTVCSVENLCEIPLGATGAPCNVAIDCDGENPFCVTKSADGASWPLGYCSSSCDPTMDDAQTGDNADCPGGGICVGMGTTGACYSECTAMGGARPCRDGYACFYEYLTDLAYRYCAAAAESQCDPTVPGSCSPGMGCIRTGLDNVGVCETTCDLFAQDCANPSEACYVEDDTGRGFCLTSVGELGDGEPCQSIDECQTGLTCFQNGDSVCRPFCGGPMNVACTNGKGCIDFSTKVKVTVVGVCGG